MINLFEYQNRIAFNGNGSGLEEFLDDIWNRRERSNHYETDDSEKVEVQRFIQFFRKSGELKSNKYVGVIHFEGEKINLLPKIFYDPGRSYDTGDITAINQHILWYLSYCRKLKFPNYQSSLSGLKGDFFEVLIYLYAKYTRELLSKVIFQQYEEMNREVHNIKGRLHIQNYIQENLSTGRWHKMNCTYDAFVMDNKFNRIIKYVTRLLIGVSSNDENKKYLHEILFILDEVEDEKATAEDCARISFNPMFSDFETVRDYCTLFLNNSISIDYKNELKLFAFLLPMEYLFEDFIYGFIDKELKDFSVKAQSSAEHLDESKVFGLRPDLIIASPEKTFIADTKYKVIYEDTNDPKKGISQGDIYQVVAYAIRYNIQDILLLYPNTIKAKEYQHSRLVVKDRLAEEKSINISMSQLPVINFQMFDDHADKCETMLSSLFSDTVRDLRDCLIETFKFE